MISSSSTTRWDIRRGFAAHRYRPSTLGCVDEGDTVARLGGDEFMILTEGRPSGRNLSHTASSKSSPDRSSSTATSYSVSASVGLAIAGVGDRDDQTPDRRAALQACGSGDVRGEALEDGGCTTSRRSSKPMPSTRGCDAATTMAVATVRLLGELRHAIDHSELTLFYQPKYDLDTLTVVGVEVLLRWQHPRLGMLAPNRFPAAGPSARLDPAGHGLRGQSRGARRVVGWYASWGEVPVAINLFAPSLAIPGSRT